LNFQYMKFIPRLSSKHPIVGQTYDLFESIWAKTLQELDGTNEFYSDPFIYADHVGVIVFRDRPIAAHIINWYDLNNPINYKLRSLSHYPIEVREKLNQIQAQTICTMEYLCLAPDFRQNRIIHFPTLMGYLSLRTLRETQHDIVMGVTHNLRKVNKACENLGMQKLVETNHCLHNVPVDFYSLKSSTPFSCHDATVSALGEKLFTNIQIIGGSYDSKENFRRNFAST